MSFLREDEWEPLLVLGGHAARLHLPNPANTMIDVLNGDLAIEDVEAEQDSGYFFMCTDTIEESESVAF